ncbi:MAG: hypothetical protein Q4D13_01590 [Erysipelotrichaceae bacterium]|nr:hypothetical protein [Erysipelotrichaceae bacterium]
MAKKKNRVRIDRIIILVLTVVLFISLLLLGGVSLYRMLNKNNSTSTTDTVVYTDPDPVNTVSDIKVELVDYENYVDDTDKLGFSFVVAELKFTSADAVSFDLGNLQTSQKIYLNSVSKYMSTLEEQGYKTSKLNVVNTVSYEKSVYQCRIFIPYTTADSALRIINAVDQSMITIDLDSKIHYVSELKLDTSQNINVNNTSVNVSSCSISTMMLHNGEEYEVASTLRVFTFRINVNTLEGNVMITDAKFVKDGTSTEIPCMNSEYSSVKAENVLGKKLVLGENGALFFETECMDESPDYSGTLFIMFSNSPDWVKVSTVLE